MPNFEKNGKHQQEPKVDQRGEADLETCEHLALSTMVPDEKPEMLPAIREPMVAPFLLDQFRRDLKHNLFEIENKEGSKHCNSIFACFVQLAFQFRQFGRQA